MGAFPNNPNFYIGAAGAPSATIPIPSNVTSAVNFVLGNMATGANSGDLKSYFGQANVYGDAYGKSSIGPYGVDPLGDSRPFQTSSAIANNPFTPANSSLIAYQIQQTNN